MKKQSVLTGALVCSLALAGCMLAGCKVTVTNTATDAQPEATQVGGQSVANPVHEGTLEEVFKATGLELKAPEGATDVVYSYIDAGEGAEPMAQTQFTLDGKKYCYRAQPTSQTSLVEGWNDPAAMPNADALNAAIENAQAFTGLYGSFGNAANVTVTNRDGLIALNEGKDGFIQWLDVVPGVMYSLTMDSGATQALLEQTATACFVPTQGEA